MGRKNYAIIILAAGNSKRLGHPKQLVKWGKSTLLNNTIAAAKGVLGVDVFLSLGGHKENIIRSLSSDIDILLVDDWELGMGNTIAQSVAHVLVKKSYDAIIISVSDQPHLTSNNFDALIASHESSNSPIVVSEYISGIGPPTLFSSIHFKELTQLSDDSGAKRIIRAHKKTITYVPFPKGDFDIDTDEDLELLESLK